MRDLMLLDAVLIHVWLWLLGAELGARFLRHSGHESPQLRAVLFYLHPVFAAVSLAMALINVALGEWLEAAILIVLALLTIWEWWLLNRHRRKKLADRLAGVVRDVGGRLKIVRQPILEGT